MNNSFNRTKIKFIIDIAYISAIVLVVYVFMKYLLSLFMPFLIALALCFVAEPTVQVLSKRLKIKRPICSAVCIALIVILLCCFCTFASVTLYTQLKELAASLPDLTENINKYFDSIQKDGNISFIEKILLAVKEYISTVDMSTMGESGVFQNIFRYFTNVFKSMPQFIMTVIVTLVFSVFVSSSFPMIKRFIKNQFSLKNRRLIHQIKVSAASVLKNYFKSYTVLMLVTFAELSAAFAIFGIRPVFALALIISLVDILPIFGVGTVMVPWGLVCIFLGDYSRAAVVLSIYAVITVIRQIIEPKIVGDSIGLPPVITLPVMFLGLKLFGIIGLFAGPMIATVIYSLHVKGYITLWK